MIEQKTNDSTIINNAAITTDLNNNNNTTTTTATTAAADTSATDTTTDGNTSANDRSTVDKANKIGQSTNITNTSTSPAHSQSLVKKTTTPADPNPYEEDDDEVNVLYRYDHPVLNDNLIVDTHNTALANSNIEKQFKTLEDWYDVVNDYELKFHCPIILKNSHKNKHYTFACNNNKNCPFRVMVSCVTTGNVTNGFAVSRSSIDNKDIYNNSNGIPVGDKENNASSAIVMNGEDEQDKKKEEESEEYLKNENENKNENESNNQNTKEGSNDEKVEGHDLEGGKPTAPDVVNHFDAEEIARAAAEAVAVVNNEDENATNDNTDTLPKEVEGINSNVSLNTNIPAVPTSNASFPSTLPYNNSNATGITNAAPRINGYRKNKVQHNLTYGPFVITKMVLEHNHSKSSNLSLCDFVLTKVSRIFHSELNLEKTLETMYDNTTGNISKFKVNEYIKNVGLMKYLGERYHLSEKELNNPKFLQQISRKLTTFKARFIMKKRNANKEASIGRGSERSSTKKGDTVENSDRKENDRNSNGGKNEHDNDVFDEIKNKGVSNIIATKKEEITNDKRSQKDVVNNYNNSTGPVTSNDTVTTSSGSKEGKPTHVFDTTKRSADIFTSSQLEMPTTKLFLKDSINNKDGNENGADDAVISSEQLELLGEHHLKTLASGTTGAIDVDSVDIDGSSTKRRKRNDGYTLDANKKRKSKNKVNNGKTGSGSDSGSSNAKKKKIKIKEKPLKLLAMLLLGLLAQPKIMPKMLIFLYNDMWLNNWVYWNHTFNIVMIY
ncbi:DNA-binding protein ABF1 SCDLUD_004074 [Saccharomycodes ludwigii]|uniref:DNA-binding protein ABF1 n=1 Tax=Saccharomycodes ludwigii TaxID=36035 RepID=UPI001E838856|nr:hypothetical protein SCDLUD_004074 [Saccharomycodes ludwigii]KAH3899783.1 hypothetical protein SCDLUD_004074 [Saccharomycodes ludwigii]